MRWKVDDEIKVSAKVERYGGRYGIIGHVRPDGLYEVELPNMEYGKYGRWNPPDYLLLRGDEMEEPSTERWKVGDYVRVKDSVELFGGKKGTVARITYCFLDGWLAGVQFEPDGSIWEFIDYELEESD